MTSGEARIIRSTVNTLLFMPSLPYVCRYPSAAAIRGSKPDGAELDPEQPRVVGDGARMSRPLPELLPILLARVAEVGRRDGAEGDDLDRLDLDLPVTDTVATPRP